MSFNALIDYVIIIKYNSNTKNIMGQELANTYPKPYKASQEAPLSPTILENASRGNWDSTFEQS
jgi:hypothetical protein